MRNVYVTNVARQIPLSRPRMAFKKVEVSAPLSQRPVANARGVRTHAAAVAVLRNAMKARAMSVVPPSFPTFSERFGGSSDRSLELPASGYPGMDGDMGSDGHDDDGSEDPDDNTASFRRPKSDADTWHGGAMRTQEDVEADDEDVCPHCRRKF